MKFLTLAVFVALFALSVAHDFHHDTKEEVHHDYYAHPKYEFKYGVKDLKTEDIKEQWEHRDGDKVHGGYLLKEADGTTRIVNYHADDHSGFHADVKTIGEAKQPETQKAESHGHHEHAHEIVHVHHAEEVHGAEEAKHGAEHAQYIVETQHAEEAPKGHGNLHYFDHSKKAESHYSHATSYAHVEKH
ncbi:larval cuticle protein A3A-like [Musca domestica]|uniref:Larval cuticle protein A3A-like n=1 Tax=Musca domestica TaxID=7370 RepID=A0A1I8ND53_MUSDO|nr:larval cuticle protein A3A-like [Musca domestica]